MKRGCVWVLAVATSFPAVVSGGTGVMSGVNAEGSGEYLFWDQQLTKGCRYRLIMQTDGNLVTYNGYNQPVWASGTWNQGGAYAYVTSRGNFAVYNWSGQRLWQTNTDAFCDIYTQPNCTWAKVHQRDNGNLQVIFNGISVLWSSNAIGPTMTGDCSITPEKVTRVRVDEDRWGGDYKAIAISEPRPAWCGGFCALEPAACQAYTYVPPGVHGPNAFCYLKNSVPAPVYRRGSGMVSGVIVRR